MSGVLQLLCASLFMPFLVSPVGLSYLLVNLNVNSHFFDCNKQSRGKSILVEIMQQEGSGTRLWPLHPGGGERQAPETGNAYHGLKQTSGLGETLFLPVIFWENISFSSQGRVSRWTPD